MRSFIAFVFFALAAPLAAQPGPSRHLRTDVAR